MSPSNNHQPSNSHQTVVKQPAGLEMGRVKTAFSCDWQEVNHAFRSVFSCFYVVHEGQFYWDLLYIVDMSECEKGSFWEVSVPKTSAAAIFCGDLYIFAKYAPVFSNRAFPTTFASHRHCHVRTYVQMRSFNFCSFSGQDVNWSGTLALIIRQHESMVPVWTQKVFPACLRIFFTNWFLRCEQAKCISLLADVNPG